MAIAQSKVLGSMKDELARTVSPQAVVATVVGGLTMYAILLALPEPFSKGVAALLTPGAMAYLGWDTVWLLIDGWLVLMKEVDQATTFEAISALPKLPGAGQAAVVAETQITSSSRHRVTLSASAPRLCTTPKM